MSNGRLAILALVLALLLVTASFLTWRKLGRLGRPAVPALVIENNLLDVERYERVVLTPMREGSEAARYTFTSIVGEPAKLDRPALPLPYAITAFEFRRPGDDRWYHRPSDRIQAFPLTLMGALSPKEWLVEIRPVLEKARDGSERVLVRMTMGHENGSTVAYFFDPEQKARPAFGWIRVERYTNKEGEEPRIHHARAVAPFAPK